MQSGLSAGFSPYQPGLITGEQLRQPRAIVIINGFFVLWTDISITTTTFYVADTFHLEIPLYGQPPGFTAQYLATQSVMNISIYLGFPPDPNSYTTKDLMLFMLSDCDEMVVDPLRATIKFSGRDLTSRFIDNKTNQYSPNQTASTIAANLAKQNNLGTSMITATQGNVGVFYANQGYSQSTLLSKFTTQWDLLTFLGQQYNYAVYVQGNDLVFAPRPTIENTKPYILQYQPPTPLNGSPIYNGISLTLTRQFTLSKDVKVIVRVPYSPQSGKAFTKMATKSNKSINSSKAGVQTYTYTYPGLTPAQAQARATSLLKNITLNEIVLNTSLPGDNVLLKSSLVRLIGTNTMFDQYYYTDTIVRTMNIRNGYQMEVHAKNMDTSSQVSL